MRKNEKSNVEKKKCIFDTAHTNIGNVFKWNSTNRVQMNVLPNWSSRGPDHLHHRIINERKKKTRNIWHNNVISIFWFQNIYISRKEWNGGRRRMEWKNWMGGYMTLQSYEWNLFRALPLWNGNRIKKRKLDHQSLWRTVIIIYSSSKLENNNLMTIHRCSLSHTQA